MADTCSQVIETEHTPKSLCPSCQALVGWARCPRSVGERGQIIWHQTPADLTTSMQHCPFCEFIGSRVFPEYFQTSDKIHFVIELRRSTPDATMVDCLADGEFEDDKQFYPYTDIMRTNCRSTDVGLDHQRLAVRSHAQSFSSSFWLVTDDGALAQRPIWKEALPAFGDRVTVIKEWQTECDSLEHGHHQCKPQNPVRLLPKRLLDLEAIPGCEDLKLVHTLDLDPVTRYTTLSHCWGPPVVLPPLRTTKSRLDDFCSLISFLSLPQNFKDAVLLTRMLNVRYLWIDSLCIVQDNIHDWEVESARMASYYQHSYLTIAAAASSHCHGGFIKDLEPSLYSPYAVGSYTNGVARMRTATADENLRLRHDLTENPFLQRAWVLQEQILSPRAVFCVGNTQMYWQCRKFFASEDGSLEDHRLRLLWCRVERPFNMSDLCSAHSLWWNVVDDYSRRHVTFVSDRGPAIAGLVEFYRSATGHTPLLGLWKETLCYDLSWKATHRISADSDYDQDPVASQQHTTEFPSWSWLSVLGGEGNTNVHMWRSPDQVEAGRYTTEIEVLSAETTWDGEPFTSPLRSTNLEVSGFVIKAVIGESINSEFTNEITFALEIVEKQETAHQHWSLPRQVVLDWPAGAAGFPAVTLLHLHQEVLLLDWMSSFSWFGGGEARCHVIDTYLCLRQGSNDLTNFQRIGISRKTSFFPWDEGVAAAGKRMLGGWYQGQSPCVLQLA